MFLSFPSLPFLLQHYPPLTHSLPCLALPCLAPPRLALRLIIFFSPLSLFSIPFYFIIFLVSCLSSYRRSAGPSLSLTLMPLFILLSFPPRLLVIIKYFSSYYFPFLCFISLIFTLLLPFFFCVYFYSFLFH